MAFDTNHPLVGATVLYVDMLKPGAISEITLSDKNGNIYLVGAIYKGAMIAETSQENANAIGNKQWQP